MGNAYASTRMTHVLVDLRRKKETIESLRNILEYDNDLTENEDYFQDDTIELGYESEADRIIAECLEKFKLDNLKQYKIAFEHVFSFISNQDFYLSCEVDFMELGKNKLAVAYYIGGEDRY